MEKQDWGFLTAPEGAVIVALEEGMEGLLYGAVELRGGEKHWLDYELADTPGGDVLVSLFREGEDASLFVYLAGARRADTETPSDRLLILWNRGQRALASDGEPLSPGELSASAPEGAVPWMLRFAGWLLNRE